MRHSFGSYHFALYGDSKKTNRQNKEDFLLDRFTLKFD